MEKPILKHCSELLEEPKVTGLVLSDANGFCILAKGSGKAVSSGLITNLSQHCNATKIDAESTPVVVFETEKMKILIKTTDQTTTAIYKNELSYKNSY